MPYKLPDSNGQGSAGELQSIQAARRALKRYPLGAKRGADAVRVRGWLQCAPDWHLSALGSR